MTSGAGAKGAGGKNRLRTQMETMAECKDRSIDWRVCALGLPAIHRTAAGKATAGLSYLAVSMINRAKLLES